MYNREWDFAGSDGNLALEDFNCWFRVTSKTCTANLINLACLFICLHLILSQNQRVKSHLKISIFFGNYSWILFSIFLKPDLVIDPVKWSGHGLDGLTRVNPKKPIKKTHNNHSFPLALHYLFYQQSMKLTHRFQSTSMNRSPLLSVTIELLVF